MPIGLHWNRAGKPVHREFRATNKNSYQARAAFLEGLVGGAHTNFYQNIAPDARLAHLAIGPWMWCLGVASILKSLRCDLNSYGDECLVKGADRSSHRTYPTRQSGEVTNCSGTLGQWTPLARVASEPRGNGASASSGAEVGLGCMDRMVSICKLL